jgi:hypothetical protein
VFQGQSGVFTFYALHEKQQSRLSKTNLFGPNRNSERKPLLSLVRDCYKEYFQRFFGIIPVQLPPPLIKAPPTKGHKYSFQARS